MIQKVRIENFKSIPDLSLDLGRVTVLIGANGSGKSNILEAIALASAASQNKLESEFLSSRGIRVTEMRFMRSAFDKSSGARETTKISIDGDKKVSFVCQLAEDAKSTFPRFKQDLALPVRRFLDFLAARKLKVEYSFEVLENIFTENPEILENLLALKSGSLPRFLIYAPENSSLRTFQGETQILPLGIKGEGLFAHLKGLNSEMHKERLAKIKEKLALIEWFETFDIPADLSPNERSIRIRDRFLADGALFDQRSANEGFLYLLFYLTLFISPETPAFFAIDNIDTSLNPKLCIEMLQQLTGLAKEFDKQVILTTHNPAVLDGLNLHDDEQRLLVVDRNKEGYTRVRRVDPPKVSAGEIPVSLSEAFMRGYIGGLPENF